MAPLKDLNYMRIAFSASGCKVGCPTPMNDKVVSLIHRMEAGEFKPSPIYPDFKI